jgi:N6-L-threonylcarbamoyladenine synthase
MARVTLGIETSCDETAAAVFSSTEGMLSGVLFSQIELHKQFGGVMPEVASRSHLEKIGVIVQQALDTAGITLDDIDTVAVTTKPGLPGSLLVGLCFAKAIAWAKNKHLIGINHLEGHAFSASIEHAVPFPHLCITASGGHTSLYLIHDYGNYTVLGQTVDDAAGEAFDKIAKLMKLPYPGGPVIEKLATEAGCVDYFHYPRHKQKTLDFSFSGLKTAVLYDLVKKGAYDMSTKTFLKDNDTALKQQVSSSLLVCIADIFEQKLERAHQEHPHIRAVTFVGGVACNKFIKKQLAAWAAKNNLLFFTPSPKYCTDNAGMIAFVGNYKAEKGEYSDFSLDIL